MDSGSNALLAKLYLGNPDCYEAEEDCALRDDIASKDTKEEYRKGAPD